MTTKLKAGTIEEILSRYKGGYGISRIAKQLTLNCWTVRYHLLAYGIVPRQGRGRPWKVDKVTETQIVTSYQDGMSVWSIAKRMGKTHEAILRTLAGNGIGPVRKNFRCPVIKIPTSSEDRAYLAGIIDGEGNLILRNATTGRLVARLTIVNTSRALIDWLGQLGGRIGERKLNNPHWKPSWDWHTNRAMDTYLLLQAVLPYLKIKQNQAKEILAYLAIYYHLESESPNGLLERQVEVPSCL